MLIVRPIAFTDLEDLYELAVKAGNGMTSLPKNRKALEGRIRSSVDSFARAEKHSDDFFLLVMEDTDKHKVVGCAGVFAQTGARQAFYAYRLMSVTHHSHSLNKQVRSQLLHLTNDYTDCSEVGALFLDPAYKGNGNWLARCRYMLIGLYPHRFAESIIAELRGYTDEEGDSPFWNAIGAHFFQMPYKEADDLCSVNSNQFITELMPKYPIYTSLLPEAAKEVIGQPATASRRAKQLLEAEGFRYERVVDIFDAGPIMRAETGWIKSIRDLHCGPVSLAPAEMTLDAQGILCNSDWNNLSMARVPSAGSGPLCSEAALSALRLQAGDDCAFLELESYS